MHDFSLVPFLMLKNSLLDWVRCRTFLPLPKVLLDCTVPRNVGVTVIVTWEIKGLKIQGGRDPTRKQGSGKGWLPVWEALSLRAATEKVQLQILWWEDKGASSQFLVCSMKSRKMAKSERGRFLRRLEMAWNNPCEEWTYHRSGKTGLVEFSVYLWIYSDLSFPGYLIFLWKHSPGESRSNGHP